MIRFNTTGVLQTVSVEIGQKVAAGTILAKVVQPWKLKAELKIAETQAKDILIGQPAQIDTRNGIVNGSVMRIDPAVVNGTVKCRAANIATLSPWMGCKSVRRRMEFCDYIARVILGSGIWLPAFGLVILGLSPPTCPAGYNLREVVSPVMTNDEYREQFERELAALKLEGEKLRNDLTRNMNALTLKVDIVASEIKEGQEQVQESQQQLRASHKQLQENHERLQANQERLQANQEHLQESQQELTANMNQLVATVSKLADFIREVAGLQVAQDGRIRRLETLPPTTA